MEFLASVWMLVLGLVWIGVLLMHGGRDADRKETYVKYVNNITCECWTPEDVERTVIKFILDNFRVHSVVESVKYFSHSDRAGLSVVEGTVIHVHAVSREKSDQCVDAHGPTDVRPDGKGGTTKGFVSHFNVVLDNASKELYLSPSKQ